MHKYISAVVLSVLASTAMAQGKWEVGVAGGWGLTNQTETLNITNDFGLAGRYKVKLKGNGPVAGVNAGYATTRNNHTFGLILGVYKDFYKPQNKGPKRDTLSDVEITSTNNLKREYTLELAAKIGCLTKNDMHLYGKVGALRSKFKNQYADSTFDIQGKVNSWGGVIGLGTEKNLGTVKIGLEYNYQYYERTTSTISYQGLASYQNKSKFRPQYHNLFLTITKTF